MFCAHRPPTGCIVAVAELVECWASDELHGRLTDLDSLFGDFGPGRYAFQLEEITPLREAIACPGAQGFWTPPAYIARQIQTQLI